MKARIYLRGGLLTAIQALGLLIAAGLAFAGTAYLSMERRVFGRDVQVPRVLEMEVEPARERLVPFDLSLELVASRYDDLVPAGQVLLQEPPPDSKFKRGRKVKVTLSLGPEPHVVPDLGGMPVARASVLLRQEKLRPGQLAYAYTETGVSGNQENLVVAQDPPAGSRLEEDAPVDFLVSRGTAPRAWVMPELVGRSLDRAQDLLERHGFRLGNVRRVADPALPAGRIKRQYPPAGYPVRRDDLISLVIAGAED